MLIKLIQCTVPRDRREQFSTGQKAWAALADCPGFLAQFGGWSLAYPKRAVIVGLWADRAAYDAFMRDVHDQIFANNGQAGAYDSIEVSLWTVVDRGAAPPALSREQVERGLLLRWREQRDRPASRPAAECHPHAAETPWSCVADHVQDTGRTLELVLQPRGDANEARSGDALLESAWLVLPAARSPCGNFPPLLRGD